MSEYDSDSDINESATDDKQMITDCLDIISTKYDEIFELWKRIGFRKGKLEDRKFTFAKALAEYADELKDGDCELEERIQESIQSYRNKVENLTQRLNVDVSKLNNKVVKCQDMTLIQEESYYKRLLKQLERIKTTRKEKLKELKKKEHELCNLLNEKSYTINDMSAVAEQELGNLESHIDTLVNEKQRRVLLIKQFQEDAIRTASESGLDIPASSIINEILEFKTIEDITCDYDFVDAVRQSIDKFKKRHVELVLKVDHFRFKICDMWAKLHITNSEIEKYLSPSSGYTQLVRHKLEEEYNRCCEIKRQNLGKFICTARDDIRDFWNKCFYSEQDCKGFELFFSDVKSDEVLEEHEVYLTNLKQYYNENSEVFALINEWQMFWANYMNFEHEYSDPNRFKSRSYSSLFEERERRRYNAELPKLESNIKSHIHQIEQKTGKTTLVFGLQFADYVKEQRHLYNSQKEEQRKERQMKKDMDLKHEAHYGSSVSTIKPLTPINRAKNKNKKISNASPAKRALHSSAAISASFNPRKPATTSASTATTNFKTNKENLIKRTLNFKSQQQQSHSTSTHQSETANSPVQKKRTSIKGLCEKFKRRSKHVIHPLIHIKEKTTTKTRTLNLVTNYENSSNESGICAGGSSSSTSNDEPNYKIQKIEHHHDVSDVGAEENFDFDYNDFISSTILEA